MNKKPFEPINSAASDYYNDDGVRFSLPFYLDVPTAKRKELLNGLRDVYNTSTTSVSTPDSMSGISVETYAPPAGNTSVEQYIGMNIDVLRSVLFQRGGLPADLILRLQAVTGLNVVTDAQLKKCFDQRKKLALDYVTNNPPPSI